MEFTAPNLVHPLLFIVACFVGDEFDVLSLLEVSITAIYIHIM